MRRRQLTFEEDCVYCSFLRQFNAPPCLDLLKNEGKTENCSEVLLRDSDSQSCPEKFALHDAAFPFVGVLEVRTVCVAAVDGQKEAPSLLLWGKNGPFKTCPALDNFIQPAPAPPSLNLHPEIRFTATG